MLQPETKQTQQNQLALLFYVSGCATDMLFALSSKLICNIIAHFNRILMKEGVVSYFKKEKDRARTLTIRTVQA